MSSPATHQPHPLNGDAQILAVTGSRATGGQGHEPASANTNFSDGNDALIGAGTGTVASIASVTIKGRVFGTPASASAGDHFGFVAQRIGALIIGGSAFVLGVGPSNDNLTVGATTDVSVHEV
jgi:hypothetical protein